MRLQKRASEATSAMRNHDPALTDAKAAPGPVAFDIPWFVGVSKGTSSYDFLLYVLFVVVVAILVAVVAIVAVVAVLTGEGCCEL